MKYIEKLNQENSEIQQKFLKKIEEVTKTIPIKVMLGDNTVSEQKTFDPKSVTDYYSKILQQLTEWNTQEVSTTQNDDIRRIFIKFEKFFYNFLKYQLRLLQPTYTC